MLTIQLHNQPTIDKGNARMSANHHVQESSHHHENHSERSSHHGGINEAGLRHIVSEVHSYLNFHGAKSVFHEIGKKAHHASTAERYLPNILHF